MRPLVVLSLLIAGCVQQARAPVTTEEGDTVSGTRVPAEHDANKVQPERYPTQIPAEIDPPPPEPESN
jgi:hypothetical protein